MRARNGETVTAEDVLDQEELAEYYRQHPRRRDLSNPGLGTCGPIPLSQDGAR